MSLTESPRLATVWNAAATKANITEVASHKRKCGSIAQDFLPHAIGNERELRHIQDEFPVRDQPREAIKHFANPYKEKKLRARRAQAINNVVAFFPVPDEIRNHFR